MPRWKRCLTRRCLCRRLRCCVYRRLPNSGGTVSSNRMLALAAPPQREQLRTTRAAPSTRTMERARRRPDEADGVLAAAAHHARIAPPHASMKVPQSRACSPSSFCPCTEIAGSHVQQGDAQPRVTLADFSGPSCQGSGATSSGPTLLIQPRFMAWAPIALIAPKHRVVLFAVSWCE